MTERTTRRLVTFSNPFSLTGIDGTHGAGTYWVETVEVPLDSLSSVAYLRVSTTIELPAVGSASLRRQLATIDPGELEAALIRDRTVSP